jgi:hypothetical protein
MSWETAAQRIYVLLAEEIAVFQAFSRVFVKLANGLWSWIRHLPGIRYYCLMLPGLITVRLPEDGG